MIPSSACPENAASTTAPRHDCRFPEPLQRRERRRRLYADEVQLRRARLATVAGTVFIHEAPYDRYPTDAGVPGELKAHALTLDAYASQRTLVAEIHMNGEAVEPELQRLLAREDVAYIHVRDT